MDQHPPHMQKHTKFLQVLFSNSILHQKRTKKYEDNLFVLVFHVQTQMKTHKWIKGEKITNLSLLKVMWRNMLKVQVVWTKQSEFVNLKNGDKAIELSLTTLLKQIKILKVKTKWKFPLLYTNYVLV